MTSYVITIFSYGRQVEPCLFAKRTHLILPVPLFVCPGFLTELLLLKWRLHFEFTTSVVPLEGQNLQDEDKGILWQERLPTQNVRNPRAARPSLGSENLSVTEKRVHFN